MLLACSVSAPVAQTAWTPRVGRSTAWTLVRNRAVHRYTRLHTDNNKDVTTSNQQQYKDSFRARVNLDPQKRYTVNIGYFSGSSFTSSWNNIVQPNRHRCSTARNNYVKQRLRTAIPVKGLEFQYGGLYASRGESDEWVSYDDDNYLVGERVSVRRPKELYLDEITVTRGAIGPLATPNLASRWDGLKNPDYTQVLGVKRFSQMVSGSLEYDRQIGADILRAAVTLTSTGPRRSGPSVTTVRRMN